ncbi:hypothetical protein LguiB_030953 [Lonicera macranthoides]
MELCTIKRQRIRRRRVSFLSDLPESLLLEILCRLPVKSIFRFKSVAKSWLSLISDPLFHKSYFRCLRITRPRPTRPAWALLYRYPDDQSPEDLWLHVLLKRQRVHPVFESPNFTLRFLSGVGREDRKAPTIVLAVSNGLILSAATQDWHDCYYVSVGFMVEPIEGNFQVVRIGGYQGSSKVVNFEIFSSKTGQWKDKMVSFDLLVRLFIGGHIINYHQAVPCKKIIHWIEYNNKIITYDTSQTDIGSDDTIQCRLIDLPSDQMIEDKMIRGMIGVCQDHLHYCHAANSSQNQNVGVWELRNYNNEVGEGNWILLYRIRFDEVNPSVSGLAQPLAFHPHSPDTIYLIRLPNMLRLASLNLRTRVCRDLVPLKDVLAWWTVFAFVLPPWPTPVPQISSAPVGLQ